MRFELIISLMNKPRLKIAGTFSIVAGGHWDFRLPYTDIDFFDLLH
jgi:hypothetical protein